MNTSTLSSSTLNCSTADDLFVGFLHWAERAPHRLAVSDGPGTWSYAGLLSEVGRIGDVLPTAVLGRPSVLAVFLPPGVPSLTGMLAAMGRGHGFVGFEIDRPFDERKAMLEVIRPCAILTNRELARRLPLGLSCPILFVEDAPDLALASWSVRRNGLLAVLSQSDTAGTPVATVITHRMMTAEISSTIRVTGLSHADHLDCRFGVSSSQFLSIVLGALTNGAQVSFMPSTARTSEEHAEWMTEQAITYSTLTPGLWRHLASGLQVGEKFTVVRFLGLNGESFHPRDIALVRQHLEPDVMVQNTIANVPMGTYLRSRCRAWRVTVNALLTMEPIDEKGVQLALEDVDRNEGEIVLSTELRSPGTWNGSGQLVPMECDTTGIERTGDYGRRLPDGRIRFLGRQNDYVKIRGIRVNLRQIERWIEMQPGVEETAVVEIKSEPSGSILVAFIVPRIDGVTSPETLRRAAARELIDAQRPEAWIELTEFPKTGTGKLDRRALGDRYQAQVNRSSSAYDGDPLDWLRMVWERVLGHGDFGIHDSFFAVGGDSLSSSDLARILGRKTGRRVSSELFWEHSTIAELAQWMDSKSTASPVIFPILREATLPRHLVLIPPRSADRNLFQHLVPHLDTSGVIHHLDFGCWPTLPKGASIETLGAHLADAIQTQWPKGIVQLVGMGKSAWVVWEAAQQLLLGGRPDLSLMLIHPDNEPLRQVRKEICPSHRLRSLKGWLKRKWREREETSQRTATDYSPEPITCPVVLIHARVQKWGWSHQVLQCAWSNMCSGPFEAVESQSRPETFLTDEVSATLASELRPYLR